MYLASIEFFTEMGTDQPDILKEIKSRLADNNWQVRQAAIQFFKRRLVESTEMAVIILPMLARQEPNHRNVAYEILSVMPFLPNLIQALDHLEEQSDRPVGLWYPNPPRAVMYLLKKADQLRTATSNTPGLLPPGRPRLETARILAGLGERLLTAVTAQGSTLLSRAAAETAMDANTLLWSWRLACICKRYFNSLEQLTDSRIPKSYREILANVFDAPADRAAACTFLKTAEAGAKKLFNYSPPSGCSGTPWQSAGLMAGLVPGWEALKQGNGFDSMVVATTLLANSLSASTIVQSPFAGTTLFLCPTLIVPWLLRFCENILDPWDAVRSKGLRPSDLLDLQGAHLEMGPEGGHWALDDHLRFRLDCRYRDEFIGMETFDVWAWWVKAKTEFGLMKIGLDWFPEIEVTHRDLDGNEETVRIEHKTIDRL